MTTTFRVIYSTTAAKLGNLPLPVPLVTRTEPLDLLDNLLLTEEIIELLKAGALVMY
ncbi:hypothetical protein [Natranaerobius trueperi]|uniref:hypothetical protein n=1 Tax=Natranaerobius trueperi TaxID=759412 RepID=UPI0013031EDC|nr:hypothetical protein [Natranaerobius trueperi]